MPSTRGTQGIDKRSKLFMGFIIVAGAIVIAVNISYSYIEKKAEDAEAEQQQAIAEQAEEQPAVGGAPEEIISEEQPAEEDEETEESAESTEGAEATDEPTYEEAPFTTPSGETEEVTATQEEETTVYEFGNENAVTIMPTGSEDLLLAHVGNISEEAITVDGRPARRITGTSAKDGSEVTYIIVDDGDQIYFIRGTAAFLQEAETQMDLDAAAAASQ